MFKMKIIGENSLKTHSEKTSRLAAVNSLRFISTVDHDPRRKPLSTEWTNLFFVLELLNDAICFLPLTPPGGYKIRSAHCCYRCCCCVHGHR